MKPILATIILAATLCACKKEAVKPAKTAPAEDIRVMVYATNGSDTTPVAQTTILRLNLK